MSRRVWTSVVDERADLGDVGLRSICLFELLLYCSIASPRSRQPVMRMASSASRLSSIAEVDYDGLSELTFRAQGQAHVADISASAI